MALDKEFLNSEMATAIGKSEFKNRHKLLPNILMESLIDWCLTHETDDWVKLLSPNPKNLQFVSLLYF